ncbi:MAG: FtsQ-type POTRA domain-containing protein [Clostridiales bacterium]|nr:FtsQ-type POTRA domain-containing protein [Clostridiales bacterium]
MKVKRTLTILIVVLFAIVSFVCTIFAFTVKSVNGDFTCTERIDGEDLQRKLDKYSGVNLLFFTPEEMIADIQSNPYLKVTNVKKSFPNVLDVSVKERKEVYLIDYSSKTYIADETGYVLSVLTVERKNSSSFSERDFIKLNFDGKVQVTSLEVGSYIQTENEQTTKTAFKLAETARLTDCVKSMTIKVGAELKEVVFETYTGVSIKIHNVGFKGEEKAEKAIALFDSLTDYQKTFDNIHVNHYLTDGETVDGTIYKNGDVFVEWSAYN